MTCIEHSATNRRELRCDLCQLIKPLDAFSKSMRKSDDPVGLAWDNMASAIWRVLIFCRCAYDAQPGAKLKNRV